MISLSDMKCLLPVWKACTRIARAPTRIDSLEVRILSLEARPNAIGEACPRCRDTVPRAETSETSPRRGVPKTRPRTHSKK